MKKGTIGYIQNKIDTGEKLTKGEQEAVDKLKEAVATGARDFELWRSELARATGNLKQLAAGIVKPPVLQNPLLVKTGFYAYIMNKEEYGEMTFAEFHRLPPTIIQAELIEWAATLAEQKAARFRNKNTKPEFVHRHYAIAYRYKVQSGEQNNLTKKQIHQTWGKKREQAVDSINPRSATYNPVSPEELKKAIELLADFPRALLLAKGDLKKM